MDSRAIIPEDGVELPAPLVGPEVDLSGFSAFMLDVDRLLSSETVMRGTVEEIGAAFLLWSYSWKQTPPASLPNDNRALASYSRSGRRWAKVREVALRGFILCADGRLYHKTMSAEALAAWERRTKYRERARKGAAGKWKSQQDQGADDASSNAEAMLDDAKRRDSEGTGQRRDTKNSTSPDRSVRGGGPTPAASRASELPARWEPDGDVEGWARDEIERSGQPIRLIDEVVKFRDHYRGKGERSPDWAARFRNWIREAIRRAKADAGRRNKLGSGARAALAASILRSEDAG